MAEGPVVIASHKHRRPAAWIFLAVALTNIIWGFALLMFGAENNVPLHSLIKAFGSHVYTLGALLIASGIAASVAVWNERSPTKLLMLITPQQFFAVLLFGAFIHAVMVSQYADGTTRSRPFIFTDQLPLAVGCLAHTVALIDYCMAFMGRRIGTLDYFTVAKPKEMVDEIQKTD